MQQQQKPAPSHTTAPRRKVFYGWYIVGAGTIQGFFNLAIFQIGLSAFIRDVQDEMGWSLTAISLGFSLKQFESGLLAPLAGYLIDRVGPRIMASIGVITMTVGLLLTARMESLWMFYLAAVVIALGQAMGSISAYSASVMHWFRRRRGLAYSFMAMGRAWAYIGAVPITMLLVLFGWRMAATLLAVGFCAISLPLAWVIRQRPEPYGYLPDGDPSPVTTQPMEAHASSADEVASFTVQEALRSSAFWLVLLANVFYAFGNNLNLVHQIPHLRNVGFSATEAASVVAFFGGIQVIGRLTCGWIGDKVGRHRLFMLSFILLSVGWLFFANASPDAPWILVLYIVTYGIGQSAHTATDQTVVADFFGVRRYATIRGLMSTMSLVGGVLGPLYAGRMFDLFGNYRVAFLTLAPIVILGTPVIFLAGTPTLSGTAAPTAQDSRGH